jgi:protein phosphatase PTC7
MKHSFLVLCTSALLFDYVSGNEKGIKHLPIRPECKSETCINNKHLELISSTACHPAPGKKYGHLKIPGWFSTTCGEDAYAEGALFAGVADGVGGWAASDPTSDSGLFSRSILHYAISDFTKNSLCSTSKKKSLLEDRVCKSQVDLVAFIDHAHRKTEHIKGSTTVALTLLQDNILHCANLGDSGILILRPEKEPNSDRIQLKTVLRSEEQQHRFNMPFQISYYDKATKYRGDVASKADLWTVEVQEKDIIIAATDGVLDNLFDRDMIQIVQDAGLDQIQSNEEIQSKASVAALKIGELSHRYGEDNQRDGPFAAHAKKFGYRYSGGKPDDIAVVVAVVVGSS